MVTTAAYDEIRNESDHGGDPTGLFSNITVGCTITQQGTIFFSDERGTQSGVDDAHGGQGILTWHRLYLLFFDRSLQKMTYDKSFTVPYCIGNGLKIKKPAQFVLKSILASPM